VLGNEYGGRRRRLGPLGRHEPARLLVVPLGHPVGAGPVGVHLVIAFPSAPGPAATLRRLTPSAAAEAADRPGRDRHVGYPIDEQCFER
jgi:small neutral amino acid transporter SnatA (MarC family)